jgi:hypothetical protein
LLKWASQSGPARAGSRASPPPSIIHGETLMKAAAYLLGALLFVVAIVYFVVPAESLPSFFPGHEPGMTRVRLKHGIASGVVGVILLAVGWFLGRRY